MGTPPASINAMRSLSTICHFTLKQAHQTSLIMKFSTLAFAGTAMATTGHMASRSPSEESLPKLTSANRMGTLMQLKASQRDASRAQGMFDEGRWPSMKATACQNGAAGDYSCENVDLHGTLSHGDMGSADREGNDTWGKLCAFYSVILYVD